MTLDSICISCDVYIYLFGISTTIDFVWNFFSWLIWFGIFTTNDCLPKIISLYQQFPPFWWSRSCTWWWRRRRSWRRRWRRRWGRAARKVSRCETFGWKHLRGKSEHRLCLCICHCLCLCNCVPLWDIWVKASEGKHWKGLRFCLSFCISFCRRFLFLSYRLCSPRASSSLCFVFLRLCVFVFLFIVFASLYFFSIVFAPFYFFLIVFAQLLTKSVLQPVLPSARNQRVVAKLKTLDANEVKGHLIWDLLRIVSVHRISLLVLTQTWATHLSESEGNEAKNTLAADNLEFDSSFSWWGFWYKKHPQKYPQKPQNTLAADNLEFDRVLGVVFDELVGYCGN